MSTTDAVKVVYASLTSLCTDGTFPLSNCTLPDPPNEVNGTAKASHPPAPTVTGVIPYHNAANGDDAAKPSLITLVALIAVALAML